MVNPVRPSLHGNGARATRQGGVSKCLGRISLDRMFPSFLRESNFQKGGSQIPAIDMLGGSLQMNFLWHELVRSSSHVGARLESPCFLFWCEVFRCFPGKSIGDLKSALLIYAPCRWSFTGASWRSQSGVLCKTEPSAEPWSDSSDDRTSTGAALRVI
jgi:hypothetical protein